MEMKKSMGRREFYKMFSIFHEIWIECHGKYRKKFDMPLFRAGERFIED